MNLTTLHWLRSPAGQSLLAELAESDLTDRTMLGMLSRLRSRYPADLARAAVEQTLLRRRARGKFSSAERLYFIREALEQASSEAVANQRASRFAAFASVADMCCGIGADSLALARAGCAVTAVERDEVRLALAAANAEVLGLEQRMTFIQADVLHDPLPPVAALYCDPARRMAGRRRFSVEQYEPPLSAVLGWRDSIPALAIKLSPGVDRAELSGLGPHELEFVSLDGELKEAVLWFGPLATVQRRATVLRSRATSTELPTSSAAEAATLTDDDGGEPAPLALPAALLYEPDPAVLRAGLVGHLAAQLGAAQLDASIAYLTAPALVDTPFARAWKIYEWFPFNLKRLRARLRDLDAGAVTVKKRGSPLDTDALARKLRGHGTRAWVVVLTHVQGQAAALLCEQV